VAAKDPSTRRKTMSAAAVDRFGGPSVLRIHALPVPRVGAHEVLIEVHTAGVGSWDADIRKGFWPEGRPRFPLILGTDGSGRIAAIGSRVRRFRLGDRVYAYSFANPRGGFYAEFVAVRAERVGRVPRPLDLRRAGAIGTTGLTALQGVDDALHVRRGEAVIVHGAGGGVGSLAVQFAKLRGARVLATASGPRGLALARRLGADAVVDGRRGDIAAAAARFAPEGVDAVLAFAGGRPLSRCLDALRRDGRFAHPNGVEPVPRRRRGVRWKSYDAVPGVRELERLGRAVTAARLRVVIAATYRLADAAKAHRRLEKGHVLGKVVLRVR
jgi:NADPH2:quinone reductase